MIKGVGIDLVEVDETQRQIETISGYLEEIFTATEIESCKARPNPYECFAARFAAKEALMKALGTGWTDTVDFRKITITSDGISPPTITLDSAMRIELSLPDSLIFYLSMTHTATYACAVVILDQ